MPSATHVSLRPGLTGFTQVRRGYETSMVDLSRQLWGLLAFTLWHERHVERTPGPLREPRLEAIAR